MGFSCEQNDVFLIEDDEPTTYEVYLNNLEFDKWLIAMKSEMDSIYEKPSIAFG